MPAKFMLKMPLRTKIKSKLPEVSMVPPVLVMWLRKLAMVLVGLSVAVSIITATPCGPLPS